MGRWLDKARKGPDVILTEPTEPSSVGSVSTLPGRFQEKLSVELVAANEPTPLVVWLHLLVLADGRVIQRCGDQITASVEQDVRRLYGDELLAVLAVPDFKRPLSEQEIVKALAGTLAAPAPLPASSSAWLIRVARLLGIQSPELLECRYLEPCDLIELASADPSHVAATIRSSPAWINRSRGSHR